MENNERIILDEVEGYTPIKITECYYDDGKYIEISSYSGTMRFTGLGRMVWLYCDGTWTIKDIIDKFSNMYKDVDREVMKNQVVGFLQKLKDKQVVETNWDALYKLEKEQELYVK